MRRLLDTSFTYVLLSLIVGGMLIGQSCSMKSGTPATTGGVILNETDPLDAQADGPATLPVPSLLKGTSAATRGGFRYGQDFEAAWPHRRVAAGAGVSSVFSPDWQLGGSMSELAYAIYRFDVTGYTYDGSINLDWASRRTDYSQLWIGLADFSADTWDWFAGPGDGRLEFDTGTHLSGSELFIAVVCLGDLPWELTSLSLGENDGTWIHSWGGDGNEWAYTLAVDDSGNVYAAGYTTTFGSAGTHIPIVKYNAAGELQWAKVLDGDSSNERIYDMLITGDEIYLAGYCEDHGPGYEDAFTVKIDADGNLIWARVWGSEDDEAIQGLAVDSSGNLYGCGYTEINSDYNRILLLKYAPDGTLLGSWAIGNSSTSHGSSGICIDDADNIYLSGSRASYGDCLLCRVTTTGTLDYATGWEGPNDTSFKDLCTDGTAVYATGNHNFVDNILVVSFEAPTGTPLWQRRWGLDEDTRGRGIALEGNDLFIIGTTSAFSAAMYYDLCLVQYTTDGTFIDAKTWGGLYDNSLAQEGYGACFDTTGNLYTCGHAPCNTGGWTDVDGVDEAISYSTFDPEVTMESVAGSDLADTTYQFTHQNGTEDTGGGGEDMLVMKSRRTYSALGQVKDGSDNPIAGVTLNVTGDQTAFAVSDCAGNYEISGLPPGDYTVTPTMPNWSFVPDHHDFTMPGSDITLVSLEGTEVAGTHTASGHVLDGDGDGVGGIKVRVSGEWDGLTETDDTGFWYVSALPDGDYTATPSGDGWSFTPVSTEFSMNGGDETVADITGTWEDWVHTWGGQVMVWPEDYGMGVAVASDGSVFVTGQTKVFGEGGFDTLTLGYDASGGLEWVRTWGTGSAEVGRCPVINGSSLFVFGDAYNPGDTGFDVAILEYDLDGNLLSQKTWGDSEDENVTGAAVDSAGNMYVTGITSSAPDKWYDVLVAKFDSTGAFQWARSWGGDDIDEGYGIAVDDTGVYVTGQTGSFSSDQQLVVLKFSADGNLGWARTWSADCDTRGNAITIGDDGGVYVACVEQSTSVESDSPEVLVHHYDADTGDLEMITDAWGGAAAEDPRELVIDAGGNIIVAGTTNSFYGGIETGMVVMFDPTGAFTWARTWDGGSLSSIWGAAFHDGHLYCTGRAENNSGTWREAYGLVTSASTNATDTPAGTVDTLTGSTTVTTGIAGAPTATEDTGGGGDDVLILRLSPE